jgi:hypothetical protein
MLKKIIILIQCTFVVIGMTAQKPITIVNKITSEHERVEGTKIYMIPPKGFEQQDLMLGFGEERTGSSIIVRESAGSYKEVTQAFMTENMTIRGIKVLQQEKFTLNDDEASLFTLEQKVHRTTFTKYMLFFGDYEYSVLISAVFPKEDKTGLAADIRKSLLSVAYKETSEAYTMPDGFSLEFEKTDLRFARAISGAVVYSGDGFTSANSLINKSLFAGSGKNKEPDWLAFSKERLQKQTKTSVAIEQTNEVAIGGLKGYELIGKTTTAEGKNRLLYQVTLFEADKYYIINGSATDNTMAQLTTFQALAKSFMKEK